MTMTIDDDRSDAQVNDLVDAMVKKAVVDLEKPGHCGNHLFRPLHKDREHAILYCQSCGLMRIVEMNFTDDGRVPLLDVPTPLAMPEDWPALGSVDELALERKSAIRHLRALVRLFGEEFSSADVMRSANQFLENLGE